MNKLTIIALSTIMVLSACNEKSVTRESQSEKNSQDYLIHSTLYAQSAAEYKALCYQAYSLARLRIELVLESGVERPAVVLDLDETVLDNSPYTAWQIASGNPYTPDTWATWVEAAEAEAVPGSVEFLQWADSNSVELFYVSNRGVDGLNATIQNLTNLKIPQADSTHIFLKTETSDKSERRDKIRNQGVEIALYIGDNLGDYSEAWDKPASADERLTLVHERNSEFGVHFIVLPNALYGTWEGAIYDYNRDLNDAEQDSLRRVSLNPWQK